MNRGSSNLPRMIACEYCRSANRRGEKICLACGAPLPEIDTLPPLKNPALKKTKIPSNSISPAEIGQIRKTGEDVDRIASTALSVYGYFWRTLAEAAIIAITGCGIGLVGGATGAPIPGVIGAAAAGFAVGWSIKMYYFILISAPIGFVIGAVFSALLWVIGLPPWTMVFPIILFAITAAILGSARVAYRRRNLWEKLRPFLGAAGGFGLGLLGTAIGVGIRAAVMAIL